MNFDAFEELKEENVEEIVRASEDPEETLRQLSEQLQNYTMQLEQEYWERSTFCSCGAESLLECECDAEKRASYMQRVSRKINDKIGSTAVTIQLLKTEYSIKEGN